MNIQIATFFTDLGNPNSGASWIASFCIAIFAFGLTCWLMMRSSRKELRKEADDIVDGILKEAREPSRQRWVDDDSDPDGAVDFVFLVLGNGEKGAARRHLVWARLRMTKTRSEATICYSPEVNDHTVSYAYELAKSFKRKNWKAKVISCEEQPNLDETGVDEWEIETP